MAEKLYLITLTSAAVFDGAVRVSGETVECDEATAKSLLHRGKGNLAEASESTSDDGGDEKPLADHTLDELRHIAAEYDIDGISKMKKADIIAAIEHAEAGE